MSSVAYRTFSCHIFFLVAVDFFFVFFLFFFLFFINFRPSRFIAWDTAVAWYKLPLAVDLVATVQQVLVVLCLFVLVAMCQQLVLAFSCYSCIEPAVDHNTGHSTEQVEGTDLAFVDILVDRPNSPSAVHIHKDIDLLLL